MNSSSLLINWLLESLEPDASVFHTGQYCGGWQAHTQGLAQASFHLLTHGECWLHIEGAQSQSLRAGDALFLLRDLSYALSSEPTPSAAAKMPRGTMQPFEQTRENGVGLVCGFFHFHGGLSELIVQSLPPFLILRAEDRDAAQARTVFGLILEESRRLPQPSAAMLERLSDLLFLYALRQRLPATAELGGLFAIARTPAFAELLKQLIAAPEKPWTLAEMAQVTGLSRSAFFKRFSELAGQSPGQVLLSLRMRQAGQLLERDQSVADVAAAVGYQSISAFTRAFKKSTGRLPGAYRRHAGRK